MKVGAYIRLSKNNFSVIKENTELALEQYILPRKRFLTSKTRRIELCLRVDGEPYSKCREFPDTANRIRTVLFFCG